MIATILIIVIDEISISLISVLCVWEFMILYIFNIYYQKFFGWILLKNNHFLNYYLPKIRKECEVTQLSASFAGQPVHLLVHHDLLSRLSGGSPKDQGNVLQQILAYLWDHTDCPVQSHNVCRGKAGVLTWTSKAFLKEIVNNLVFKSTLAYLSITNSIFGFLVRVKE